MSSNDLNNSLKNVLLVTATAVATAYIVYSVFPPTEKVEIFTPSETVEPFRTYDAVVHIYFKNKHINILPGRVKINFIDDRDDDHSNLLELLIHIDEMYKHRIGGDTFEIPKFGYVTNYSNRGYPSVVMNACELTETDCITYTPPNSEYHYIFDIKERNKTVLKDIRERIEYYGLNDVLPAEGPSAPPLDPPEAEKEYFQLGEYQIPFELYRAQKTYTDGRAIYYDLLGKRHALQKANLTIDFNPYYPNILQLYICETGIPNSFDIKKKSYTTTPTSNEHPYVVMAEDGSIHFHLPKKGSYIYGFNPDKVIPKTHIEAIKNVIDYYKSDDIIQVVAPPSAPPQEMDDDATYQGHITLFDGNIQNVSLKVNYSSENRTLFEIFNDSSEQIFTIEKGAYTDDPNGLNTRVYIRDYRIYVFTDETRFDFALTRHSPEVFQQIQNLIHQGATNEEEYEGELEVSDMYQVDATIKFCHLRSSPLFVRITRNSDGYQFDINKNSYNIAGKPWREDGIPRLKLDKKTHTLYASQGGESPITFFFKFKSKDNELMTKLDKLIQNYKRDKSSSLFFGSGRSRRRQRGKRQSCKKRA